MSPGPSHQAEQKDRLTVLKNEQAQHRAEHEPSTMFAMANLGIDTSISSGRQGREYVSGSEPHVSYPSAAGPWADPVRVPDEPPLNYAIGEMVPCGEHFEVARSLASLPATALISADAGNGAECAPTLAATPSAEVVETSAPNSLISSASASPAGDGDGARTEPNHSSAAPFPTLSLSRPRRRL